MSESSAKRYKQHIANALEAFSGATDGAVQFGDSAVYLNRRGPEGHLRSRPAPVRYLGREVGRVTTMLFRSQDGTGKKLNPTKEAAGRQESVDGRFFPATANIVPAKEHDAQAIHGDVHLALLAYAEDEEAAAGFQPHLLAGSLEVFRAYRRVTAAGYLGQNAADFARIMAGEQPAPPIVTKTINPRRLEPAFSEDVANHWSKDRRAVYNPYEGIAQVAGFITLDRTDEGGITTIQAGMLHRLGVIDPVPGRDY